MNTSANKIQNKLNEAERKRARCLDPDWVYTPAAATDIRKTWLKFGWKPSRSSGYEGYEPINEQFIHKEDKDELA